MDGAILSAASGSSIDALVRRLIQLVIKHFVLPWYQRISTAKDHHKQPFIIHVQSTLIHVARKLEQALQSVDYLQLLLTDVPETISLHLGSVRTTAHRLRQLDHSGDPLQPSAFDPLFLLLHPHPALQLTTTHAAPSLGHPGHPVYPATAGVPPIPRFPTATTLVSPTYLRLFLESLLRALLPREAWESENERLVLREILLHSVLVPILCEFTQPRFIHTRLLVYLSQVDPPNTPSSSPPEHPPTTKNGNLRLRFAWDQVCSLFDRLVHLLLLLPAILGSFIHLITAPTPIPVPEHSNPRQFEPILELLSHLLGNSAHLTQLFWLLNLAARFSNRLLTNLLTDLDHGHEEYHDIPKEGSDESLQDLLDGGQDPILNMEKMDSKEIKMRLEKLLSSKIPDNLFKFIKPIKSHSHSPSTDPGPCDGQDGREEITKDTNHYETILKQEKESCVEGLLNSTINFHSSNVALSLDLLDLIFIKLFTDLISQGKNTCL